MLGSRRFEKRILLLVAVALIFSLTLTFLSGFFNFDSVNTSTGEYAVKFFGKSVVNIEILVDETSWDDMLNNKMSKPYISCNLKIDGAEFSNVGLRPKGNSSLTSIQGERIGYRLDFDHYVSNQTCYGLEQMVLNNLQADATYMKDYIAYDLMSYEGVNAPLHTYAFLTLNGEPFGLYLAVEVYDEDYLSRVYNNTNIKLYNVKSSGFDEFENAIVDVENGSVIQSKGMEKPSAGGVMPPPPGDGNGQGMPPPPQGLAGGHGMPPAPGGGEGGGGDLVYVDDSTDSYKTIFANAVSKHTDAKDYAKVIKAIKYLNKTGVSKEELEKYWDVDSILRYLAVHTFMVNGDSYTGNMKQNYYLAEINGKITVLPWDYNLSFGTFGGGPGVEPPHMKNDKGQPDVQNQGDFVFDNKKTKGSSQNETTEVINHAIDTPTIGVDMESRPLVSVLLGKEEYMQKYHSYLSDLIMYASGEFINKLEMLENEIYPYVSKETVSFYTPQEQLNAFNVLKKFIALRCKSIDGQLNGTIASKTQSQISSTLITADFSINDMGSMGEPGGPGGNQPPDMAGSHGIMPPGENSGHMMPPPPGMPHTPQGNSNSVITILVSLIILCIAFVAVFLFKRNY
ncbi:MAG: hypothetical protein E7395_02250 [Ruminococcaceae bacterium]|nr:hypothetical protein [Oscillospiraceae bacterium]